MANKPSISVIIIKGGVFDKEVYKECLASIDWVDEKIIIETDKLKGSFSDFRNIGAKKAKSDWLLYIDTDEVITGDLRQEIEFTINNLKFTNSTYAIPRKNIIFGKEMRHGGLWPDYVLRLIKKDSLKEWKGELHEQPDVYGKIKHMVNPLIHYKNMTITQMVDKTNKWSEIEAKLMFEAHHPPMNIWRFASAGFREFWHRMIIQTAFLDGPKGVIYGLYQVYSRLISYSKLWELQLTHARSNS